MRDYNDGATTSLVPDSPTVSSTSTNFCFCRVRCFIQIWHMRNEGVGWGGWGGQCWRRLFGCDEGLKALY